MNTKFFIVQTNKYTGNFEREFMAFVFGIEDDEYGDNTLEILDFYKKAEAAGFYSDNGEESPFAKYIDCCGFGTCYSQYHSYEICPHPVDKTGECDSIIIALRETPEGFKFPPEVLEFIKTRMEDFPAYMASLPYPEEGIEIISAGYYEMKFVGVPA